MDKGLKHVWRRGEMHAEFWRANLRERDLFEDFGLNRRKILR
jgi:hypothetical protein